MESKTENRINECISHLDITYSYQLAKQMETHKTNPVLGFRTAGSDAEHKTGDFLYEEMKRIGLQNVTKDAFWLDSWTFEHAVLRFQDQRTMKGAMSVESSFLLISTSVMNGGSTTLSIRHI